MQEGIKPIDISDPHGNSYFLHIRDVKKELDISEYVQNIDIYCSSDFGVYYPAYNYGNYYRWFINFNSKVELDLFIEKLIQFRKENFSDEQSVEM